VSNTPVSTESLGMLLKHCPQLEKLYADECSSVTGKILSFLGKDVNTYFQTCVLLFQDESVEFSGYSTWRCYPRREQTSHFFKSSQSNSKRT
jgi:hypothetical protein